MELLPRNSSTRVEPFDATSEARDVRQGRSRLRSVLETIVQQAGPTWRRSKVLLRRTLEVSTISNTVAVVCALVYGAANPFLDWFAGDAASRERATQGTATLVVFYFAFSCIGSTSVLYAFFLRGRLLRPSTNHETHSDPLSLASSFWVTVCLTWKGAFVLILMPSAVTAGLFAVGFPVLRYNVHTFVTVVFIAIHSVLAISCVVQFRQKRTISVFSPPIASVDIIARRVRANQMVRKSLRQGLLNVFPTLLAAIAGMQFTAIGKRLDASDRVVVGAFVATTLVVKFLLQLAAKLLALKIDTVSGNTRNRLYRITSLILISEISLPMAMIRLAGPSNTSSLYAGTVLVGFLEILFRAVAVLLDQLVIEKKRCALEKKKHELMGGEKLSRQLKLPSIKSAQVAPTRVLKRLQQTAVSQLDNEFEAWKATHLRLSAVEVMAETMAEYCGIGFACVYMISLRVNPVFGLGLHDHPETETTSESLRFITTQLTTYAVQMAVEIVSGGGSS